MRPPPGDDSARIGTLQDRRTQDVTHDRLRISDIEGRDDGKTNIHGQLRHARSTGSRQKDHFEPWKRPHDPCDDLIRQHAIGRCDVAGNLRPLADEKLSIPGQIEPMIRSQPPQVLEGKRVAFISIPRHWDKRHVPGLIEIMQLFPRRHPKIRVNGKLLVKPARAGLLCAHAEKIWAAVAHNRIEIHSCIGLAAGLSVNFLFQPQLPQYANGLARAGPDTQLFVDFAFSRLHASA